jgi:hypothetical protein
MTPSFQNNETQKLWCLFILVIILVPTYFIHTSAYPDWGDDFAQYVYQGQQINSPSETYKQVLNIEEYSSPKRSVFFSVILSVIYPTIQIQNYVNLISISYILAAVCFFLFLSGRFSLTISFIATLSVFYNFLFLRLKSEVVPEFLFISLFYLILYLTLSTKNWVKYVIPILLGLLVSIRFVGLSLLLGYLVFLLVSESKTLKQKMKDISLCLLIFSVIIIFINHFFLSSVNNQEIKLYGTFVLQGYNFKVFFNNISIYPRYLALFFEQEIPYWMNTIITFCVMSVFIVGLTFSLKSKRSIINYSFGFYFLFLIFYPYNGDTIKYLIPIVPLVIYYIIFGMNFILGIIHFKKKEILIVVCLSIITLSNSKTIWLAISHKDNKIGPYELSVLKDFETIKKVVNDKETIAFGKPFIINLLVDRDAYFLSNKNYKQVFANANYVLSPKQKIQELYPKIEGIKITKGDTSELSNFYLIKI